MKEELTLINVNRQLIDLMEVVKPLESPKARKVYELLDQLTDIINDELPLSGWVSVKDRLPEEYGEILCYRQYIGMFSTVYNPKHKLFNVSFDNVESAIDVEYWHPMLKPPVKEE